ncbi:MAG: hypothetical protein WC756_17785 [Taibaiella sp.]|jgi:hypothetical protein
MVNVPEYITIQQAIEFHQEFNSLISERLEQLEAIEDPFEKELESIDFEIEQAYLMASFFSEYTALELQETMPALEVLFLFREKMQPLFITEADMFRSTSWNNETWELPPVELKPESIMVFGEFIDSKVMVQDVIDNKGSKWEMLLYIATIFFRKENEEYQGSFLFENSDRSELMKSLPLSIAAGIGTWYEAFNEYLQDYFPVFSESQIKSGAHIRLHMNQWGWVNFLKSVAATKVFDVANSGLNSIDCARRAKAYDVLVAASEEKQYNEAQALDMEAATKTH